MALKRSPSGIYALCSDGINLNTTPELLNANVDGWRLRIDWNQIQTSAGTSLAPTSSCWNMITAILNTAHANGKRVGMSVGAGSGCPDWLFSASTAGDSTHSAYYVMADPPAGSNGKMPMPNDPVFVDKWTTFVAAFGAKFDGNHDISYTVIGGLGDHYEWFWGNGADQDGIVARDSGAINKWKTMAQTIITAYASAFPTTPFMAAIARPFSGGAASTAEKAVVDWARPQWARRFGLTSSALNASTSLGFYPACAVNAYWKNLPTGFQMVDSQSTNPTRVGGLGTSLLNAVNLHGRYVEVYRPDLADSTLQATINTYRTKLKNVVQPVLGVAAQSSC